MDLTRWRELRWQAPTPIHYRVETHAEREPAFDRPFTPAPRTLVVQSLVPSLRPVCGVRALL